MKLRIEHSIDGHLEDVFEKESTQFTSQGKLVMSYLADLLARMADDEQVRIFFIK